MLTKLSSPNISRATLTVELKNTPVGACQPAAL
jgi:hypothetical protein